jgi:phage tail-like protein
VIGMPLRLIDLLPPSIAEDEFTRRFVEIFDRIEASVAQRIEHADDYFDLTVAPIELVRLMASWVNLSVPPTWSDAQQRSFVIGAVGWIDRRGTASWLSHLLSLATGCDVVVEDPARVTTGRVDATATQTPVTVRLRGRCDSLTPEQITHMVRAELPVGVAYRLELDDREGLDG